MLGVQVMPLMGEDAIFPENAIAAFYRQYLTFDGMDGVSVTAFYMNDRPHSSQVCS